MLDVRRLILLRDLSEYGTVSAVAELHQVTPSAVSQQLRALENETGVSLLHREGRTVRLTAAGAALAAQCEHVLAALEQAHSAVHAVGDVSGEIVIGCMPSGLATIATPLVATLAARHPNLRPRIIEVEPEHALRPLKQRALDLAISYRYRHLGTPVPNGLTAHALFEDPLRLAVPQHLRPQVEQHGLVALREQPWISPAEPSVCGAVLKHACHAAGFAPIIRHNYHDLAAGLTLVAAGLAVTFLPNLLCRRPPPGVTILPMPNAGRTIEAVIRTGTNNHPAIAACLTVLTDHAPANTEPTTPQHARPA